MHYAKELYIIMKVATTTTVCAYNTHIFFCTEEERKAPRIRENEILPTDNLVT